MLKLIVPDMSCGHCVAAVEQAVRSVDPAASVAVDLPTKLVTIGTSADPAAVAAAIDDAGYPSQAA